MSVPHPPEMTEQNPPSAAGDSGPDPLAKLHHMSTTAGVASQRYVAVNTTAIVAALLGLASGLAIFSSLLLVISLVGIVVSLVAWRQIHSSGGTEAGTPMAAIGLILSLAFGGGVLWHLIQTERTVHADVNQMSVILNELADDVKADKYQEAYALFDKQFQDRIQERRLQAHWLGYQRPDYFGRLQSLTWNGVAPFFESVHGGDERLAKIQTLAKFQKGEIRLTFLFRNSGDGWKLEDLQEFFDMQ